MRKVMLSELEGTLEKYCYGAFDDGASFEVQIDEDSILVADDPEVQVPEYGIAMREGTMLSRYEDGGFYPDWSLTVIYPMDKNPEAYLYYEQDGMAASLYNYLHSIGKEPHDVECIIPDLND